ncbi:MAG: GNAT family N-acetyltransferase [Candidatus Poribacteria bacterium]|nr:GNAT family N-acetyltransferase [Candidatus Poribacteria bacterium]
MEFRALYPNELEAWLDHVTHVFSASRQYFSNHWHNDPWKDAAGIRVAVDDGTIVSTVRVFIRKMFFHGEPISVGGIGEVSTRPEYRKHGLATQLLKDSIRFMENRGIAISMLHGSQRIYSVEGWESVPRYYAKKTLIGREQQAWNIHPVNFQDTDEIAQLASLYHTYSRKFNGTFVRDDMAYWTDWVKTESPQTWVAERDGVIEGYVSVRRRNELLNVKEFAASEELFAENRATDFFDVLLSDVIVQMDAKELEVEYPAPIADGFSAQMVEWYGSTMYRVIQPDAFPPKMRQEISEALPDLLHSQSETLKQDIRSHHILWSTDGF